MLPEVEEYFRTVERADRIGGDKGDTVREAAWTLLGAVTENSLVEWIVGHCAGEDHDNVDTVLRELPLTVAELRALGKRHDWCGEFDELLDQAIEDGALQDDDPAGAAWNALVVWVRDQLPDVTDEQLASLKERVGAVVDAHKASAASADQAAPVAQTAIAPAAPTPADSVAELDITEWAEWGALSSAAAGAGAHQAARRELQHLVTAVALEARANGVHAVERSAPATALRTWVINQGAGHHEGQLRTLMEPIVRRAARR